MLNTTVRYMEIQSIDIITNDSTAYKVLIHMDIDFYKLLLHHAKIVMSI